MSVAVVAFPRQRSSSTHIFGLIWTLVRTDFKTRYHGTIQGFVWALLKPMTMFLVLMAVFSFIFASEPSYRLNLIIGLFLWDFFAQGTAIGLGSLQAKGYLISKVRFPSWIIVVTSISNALITLAVFGVTIIGTLVLVGRAPAIANVFLFFWYVILFVAVVVGFSLATSVLFLRYRDLNQVWEVVLQAGFFVSPIIYPLSILPERFHKYLYLWPPTPVIQFARSVLIGGVAPTLKANVFLLIEAVVVFSLGVWIFCRNAPRTAEYL
jgi:lipopolysaccharide transport system permease protein